MLIAEALRVRPQIDRPDGWSDVASSLGLGRSVLAKVVLRTTTRESALAGFSAKSPVDMLGGLKGSVQQVGESSRDGSTSTRQCTAGLEMGTSRSSTTSTSSVISTAAGSRSRLITN
jgi:hypothetical protein